MSSVYACRFVHAFLLLLCLAEKHGHQNKNILNIRVQLCSFSPIYPFAFYNLSCCFQSPFLREVLFLFSHVFFPGASLDQFTKSPSWEQYNLAKGTIFIIMSIRAEVTGFTGRIFANLEKGQFRVNPNPYSFPSGSREGGRASPATPMIPYPLSGPAQIIMCFLNPLSSIHRHFPPNGVFLRLCDKKRMGVNFSSYTVPVYPEGIGWEVV
jgi:hypothetical protein